MSKFIKDLVASLEEGELNVPAEDSPEVHADEAAAVVEIIEIGDQVELAHDAAEQVANTTESLEAFDLLVTARLASGKAYSFEEMKLLGLGVASTMNGIGAQVNFLPSMEEAEMAQTNCDNGDEQALVQVSQEASEGIKATLIKMWEAVKRSVSRVWEIITTFFAKLFSSVSDLKARGVALSKASPKGKANGKIKVSAELLKEGSIKATLEASHKLLTDVATAVSSESKLAEARAIRLAKGESTDEDTKELAIVSEVNDFDKKEGKAEEVEASSINVKEIGSAVVSLANVLANGKDVAKKLKESQESLLKKSKDIIDKSTNTTVGGAVEKMGARASIYLAKRNIAAPYTKACKIALKLGYTAAQVGQKVVSSYKEEKAA